MANKLVESTIVDATISVFIVHNYCDYFQFIK